MQYLFNERLLQEAAAVVHDAPTFPNFEIPATSEDVFMPHSASRIGREKNRRRRRPRGRHGNSNSEAADGRVGGGPQGPESAEATEPLLTSHTSTPPLGDSAV